MPALRFRLSPWLAIALCAWCGAARCDDAATALRALQAGDAQRALSVVDRALSSASDDVSLRFTRGVVLAELRRDDEAAGVFRALSESHPELPEPLNNLAVLQARAGDADAARASLEAAVRSNPRHAIALENLGDVYATLAARAWAQAAEIDPQRKSAASKLALIRELQARPGAVPTASLPLQTETR